MSDEQVEVPDGAPPATNAGTAAAAGAGEDLTLLLEDARNRADEHWNQVVRMQAELENQRKRATRDLENAHKYALDRFVAELLPVKDSLELGLAAAADGNDTAIAKLREGTALTLKMLTQVFEKFGVREINPLGEAFNPEFHQAMTLQPTAHTAPNTVLNVFQKGYTLNERLVRPAMVVVSAADEQSGNDAHVDVRA